MPVQQLLLVSVPEWNLASGKLTIKGWSDMKHLLSSFPWEFKDKDWEILSGTLPRSKETARVVRECFHKEADVRENPFLNVCSRRGGVDLTSLLDTNLIPIPVDCNHAIVVMPNQDTMSGLVHGIRINKGQNGYFPKIPYPAILIFLTTGEIEEIRQAEPKQLEFE